MNKNDLSEIIRNGENSGIEFKRDDVHAQSLAKEIAALANLEGGYILLGVEDDGTVSGLMRPDIEEWIMTRLKERPFGVLSSLSYLEQRMLWMQA